MQHLVCDYAEMFSFDMFQDNTGLTGQDALQTPVCASIQALFIDFLTTSWLSVRPMCIPLRPATS